MKHYLTEDNLLTVEAALENTNLDVVKMLAALTPEQVPSRKADAAAVIVRFLGGEGLRKVWEGLDELQKAAVSETIHSGSARFDGVRFRAKYGKDPNWGTSQKYKSDKPSLLGFIFYHGFIPADLKQRLKAFVPAPRAHEIAFDDVIEETFDRPYSRWNLETRIREEGTEPVPIAVHERERAAQRELLSVLRLIDGGKVAVSDATRRPSASTVAAIGAILEGGDYYPHVPSTNQYQDENAGPIRAFAWPMLIQAGGLAQLSGTKLQLTKAGRKALSEPAAGTIRTLWSKWLGTSVADELARIDCIKGQTGKGKRGLTAASSRRGAIDASLGECPAGKWIEIDEFRRYMQASGNDFEVARDAWGLYICEAQYGSLGFDGNARILNVRYIMALLLEYASTLGIVDVALIPPAGARRDYRDMWGTDELPFFSRYDGLLYFRITPLGAWCLDIATAYTSAPVEMKQVLRVLPNLEIVADGTALEAGDRLALNAYATPVSDFVWRIEMAKLLAAVEEGRPVAEFREFMKARSGEIPDTVARLLEDAEARCTLLHDRGLGRLVECADAALAALIANDTKTRKHCMRAGERHLVVPASSEAAFRRGLRDSGYLLAGK